MNLKNPIILFLDDISFLIRHASNLCSYLAISTGLRKRRCWRRASDRGSKHFLLSIPSYRSGRDLILAAHADVVVEVDCKVIDSLLLLFSHDRSLLVLPVSASLLVVSLTSPQ